MYDGHSSAITVGSDGANPMGTGQMSYLAGKSTMSICHLGNRGAMTLRECSLRMSGRGDRSFSGGSWLSQVLGYLTALWMGCFKFSYKLAQNAEQGKRPKPGSVLFSHLRAAFAITVEQQKAKHKLEQGGSEKQKPEANPRKKVVAAKGWS